ncbi:hypothetical protein Tco_1507628 [Tanacetum coccineum]
MRTPPPMKVKGNDVGGYTQRFQELALMCHKIPFYGHYKSDCPDLKNQNHGNQAECTEARGMVYALGGETNQDLNNMKGDMNA